MTVTREDVIWAMAKSDFMNWPFGIDPKTAAEHYGDMADAVLELLEGTKK